MNYAYLHDERTNNLHDSMNYAYFRKVNERLRVSSLTLVDWILCLEVGLYLLKKKKKSERLYLLTMVMINWILIDKCN
jgi:hypothetical protein